MNTASQANDNFGFYAAGGAFHSVNYPAQDNASPPVNQLLGVNDHDVAVGFYTDAKGGNHGYEYDIAGNRYSQVIDPGHPGASLTAAAIDNDGDVAGFYGPGKTTYAFLKTAGGEFDRLAHPGRRVHPGARRQRQRRGGGHLHHRQRRQRPDARLHLDPAARLPHRR